MHDGPRTEGDRLPTFRALATDLGVAAGTIARAYTELENDGLVIGRRRLGTTVTHAGRDPAQSRLQAAANRLVTTARADGLDRETMHTALHTALDNQALT